MVGKTLKMSVILIVIVFIFWQLFLVKICVEYDKTEARNEIDCPVGSLNFSYEHKIACTGTLCPNCTLICPKGDPYNIEYCRPWLFFWLPYNNP